MSLSVFAVPKISSYRIQANVPSEFFEAISCVFKYGSSLVLDKKDMPTIRAMYAANKDEVGYLNLLEAVEKFGEIEIRSSY